MLLWSEEPLEKERKPAEKLAELLRQLGVKPEET
jgi:hypothetical protein